METDETMYHATPQTKGKLAHATIDTKKASNRADDILALPIYSEEYGLMGKIDLYKRDERKLIERKYQLKHIYQGQIYQLWAQMLCMQEMGYVVESIAFYEISTNKMTPVKMPTNEELQDFKEFIKRFKSFVPGETIIPVNPNKCRHCIYNNLCDKTQEENVY